MTRLPDDKMPGLLRQPHPDVPLGLYRHEKSGGQYLVVGGTFLATGEDQLVYVQYVSLDKGYSAHRTAEDFLELVPHHAAPAKFPPVHAAAQARPGRDLRPPGEDAPQTVGGDVMAVSTRNARKLSRERRYARKLWHRRDRRWAKLLLTFGCYEELAACQH